MTRYELLRNIMFPFTLPHYQLIRSLLKEEARACGDRRLAILDVGGRKSPYTVGLRHRITIIDLPRQRGIQRRLGLGLDDGSLAVLREKRSNVEQVILGDFLTHDFGRVLFDVAVAVEVIEHFREDHHFLERFPRILKNGGVGIFTTPNGDCIKLNRKQNPDHWRHYTKRGFEEILAKYFVEVDVRYFARLSTDFVNGLKPWNPGNPLQLGRSMYGNFTSYRDALSYEGADCAYLVAVVRKPIRAED